MKTLKRIEIAIVLLIVAVIIFASFFGVYKKEDFRTVDIIKDYKKGMQFTDAREIKLTVNNEEIKTIYDSEGNIVEDDGVTEYSEENGYKTETTKLNNDEILTQANYKLTKRILKNRLKGMGVGEYKINLNKETGEISVKLQENDETDEYIEHLEQKGLFTIIDKETEEVLLDNSHVKFAKVVYGANGEDQTSTIIYLQINFNKEGAKKLEEISQIYVATTVEKENEEGELEETEEKKEISVVLDEQTLSSTYFGEKMSTGILYVPITSASDNETLSEYGYEINTLATIINEGQLPIEYTFLEETVQSNITTKIMIIIIAVPSIVLLAACIFMICKFKLKGFIALYLQIGFIALVLLAIRYTNVIITITGVIGVVISAIVNYILVFIMLNNLKQKNEIEWKKIGKFAIYTSPVYLAAIILTFNSLTIINSLGMVLVWGSFSLYIYNLTITKTVLKMLNK